MVWARSPGSHMSGSTAAPELVELRFRAAVAAAGVMWTNDASGRMTGAQPGWAELTGQSEQEYQGYGWTSAVHPDDAQRTVEAWNQAVADKRTFEFTHRVRSRDGEWRHFAIRAVPVMQDGTILEWVGVHIDVTDREKAVEELKASERRSQTILESITDGFFTLDDEWRFDYVNPEAERILNCAPGALLGQVLWDEYPGTAGTEFEHTYRRVAAEKKAQSFQAFYPDHGRWYDVRAFPLPVGLSVYFRDVTDAKQAEELLRRNRDTFYALIKNNPFGMYVVDSDFKIAQFSEGARRAFANVQPVIGRDFAEVMRTLWPESFSAEAGDRHTLATGQAHTAGLVERRRDLGEVEAYDWRIERVTLPDGRFGVVCHFYDLTERQELENKLRDSENRLRIATNAAGLGIWTWQPDSDKVRWDNKRPFEIFGLHESDSPVDARRFISEFLHPEDLPLFEQTTARIVEDGAEFLLECRIRRRDGGQRWIRFTGKGTQVGEPQAFTIIGTVEDITERKAAEERVLEFASQLSEADRRKDEFLATLAHELRNPLAPIRNGLQIIRRTDSPAALEKATAMMDRQIKQMVRLVDDLLDISRISRDKLQLQKGRVTLSAVLAQAVETSQALIAASGHKLLVSAPAEPVVIDGDVTRLVQVFSNLISNAAKYSEGDSPIWLTSEASADEVLVRVKDFGVGIPADMLPRIFDMFVQVDRSLERSQGGLGIGLTLVKRLVELHGGSIEARSDGEDKGSEFLVRLPLVRSLPDELLPQSEQANSSQRLHVLIADDNEDAAESLAQLLEMMGSTVHRASDGLQAVAMAQDLRPEVIVLDIGMPRLNGFEACRRIRTQSWSKGVVIIALTGWGQDEDRRRSMDAGFDRHLVKPVDPLMLEKLLSDLR